MYPGQIQCELLLVEASNVVGSLISSQDTAGFCFESIISYILGVAKILCSIGVLHLK